MSRKSSGIGQFENVQRIAAACMDEGWSTLEIEDMMKRAVEAERGRRMLAVAAATYGPATKNTTPQAAAIVASAKLRGGVYGIGEENTGVIHNQGSASYAVAAALARGRDHRLYRMADAWRFVGIVRADGSFVDERPSR